MSSISLVLPSVIMPYDKFIDWSVGYDGTILHVLYICLSSANLIQWFNIRLSQQTLYLISLNLNHCATR